MKQHMACLMRESGANPAVGDASASSVKCARHDDPHYLPINELAETKHTIWKVSVVGHDGECRLDQSVDPDRSRPIRQQLRILKCSQADALDLAGRKVRWARVIHKRSASLLVRTGGTTLDEVQEFIGTDLVVNHLPKREPDARVVAGSLLDLLDRWPGIELSQLI